MKFKGERIQRLEEMQKGKMYVIIHEEFDGNAYDAFRNAQEKAYAFVYLNKEVHEKNHWGKETIQEITYFCDIINAPEGESEFKLFETIDQVNLDNDESALYSLVQI